MFGSHENRKVIITINRFQTDSQITDNLTDWAQDVRLGSPLSRTSLFLFNVRTTLGYILYIILYIYISYIIF